MTPQLPDETREQILAWFGADGQAFVDALPATVAALAAAWGFTGLETLTGGAVSYVAGVTLADGTPAVLKVAPGDAESRHEPDALELYDGRGAVRLLRVDRVRHALLLERLAPGTPLYDAGLGWDDEARIAAPLIARLALPPPPGHPFTALADDARTWDVTGERIALVERLAASSPPAAVVVNRDLHALNILRDGDGWRAIDPKPLVGDPAFTAGAMLRDRRWDLEEQAGYDDLLRRRLEILCNGTGDDPWRVAAWAACYAEELGSPVCAEALTRVSASTPSTSRS